MTKAIMMRSKAAIKEARARGSSVPEYLREEERAVCTGQTENMQTEAEIQGKEEERKMGANNILRDPQ